MPVSSSSSLCRQQRPQPSHKASHWPRSSALSGCSQNGACFEEDAGLFMTSLSMVCYRIAIKRGWKSLMSFKHMFLAAIAAAIVAAPVGAQLGTGTGYDGHKFVAAVRDRDGNKAMELLQAR